MYLVSIGKRRWGEGGGGEGGGGGRGGRGLGDDISK